MYISHEYLHALHYYFFFMGIMSFFAAFLSPLTSVYLIFFYIVHSVYSWLLTWYMHTRVKSFVIIRLAKYLIHHVIVTVLASVSMFLLYSLFLMDTIAFTVAIVQLNFYIFFIAFCWFIIAKLRLINRVFNVQEEIRIEYPEPVSEGAEIRVVTRTIKMPKKPEGFKDRKPPKEKRSSPDLRKEYQIEIYQSQIKNLSEKLKRTRNEGEANFYRKRIEEYRKKIRSLRE